MTSPGQQHRERIRLGAIVFDAGTQARAAINEETVAEYADAMTNGATFPPVVLFHDGNRYYMGDGFHRALAAQRIDARDIPAEVRPGTAQDALWFALGANKANGTRLTPADKRHAILRALETWPEKSANQIAEQIGCGQQYVSRIREEVTPMRNLPARVTGKDGKSYPATREPRPVVAAPIVPSPSASAPVVPRATDPVVPRRQPTAPPANGLQFARIAIMKLEEIRDDDAERQQAFSLVRRWLDARKS